MATMVSTTQTAAPPLPAFENNTLTRLFFHVVDQLAGPAALRYRDGADWKSIPHAEVERRVTRFAAALDSLGVGAGDRVAILSENRPEWAIADFAVLALGAADVPIYATLPPNQISYILRDAGAKVICVSTVEQLTKITAIRHEVPSLRAVVLFDDPRGSEGVLSYASLLEQGEKRLDGGALSDFRQRALAIPPDALATLIYTSGTTGEPKGVMLTHFNIASNVEAVRRHHVLDLKPGDVALSFLPLSHSFERMVDYYYWGSGATIAYVDSVDKVAESLIEAQPHVVAAAPRVFEKIYGKVMGATGVKRVLVRWAKRVGESGVAERIAGRRSGPRGAAEKLADRLVFSKLRARTGGRIGAFISGSAPLSADIARFFWAAGIPVLEGYGLTETSPVLTVNRPGAVKLGTVGQPLPGTELRISAEGEILARGPQIMKGYWNRPDATAEVIDEEGWFHTGDIGTLDSQGFLTITDRLKNLLVTAGGKNIAPQPIENQVAMSPHIAQVVMLGDKRPFASLLVVPDFENLGSWARSNGIDTADRAALAADPRVREFLQQEAFSRLHGLARYEMPKKIAVLANEFTIESGELTPSLKVKRRAVEEHYADVIEALYAGARDDS
ncbi:MAG: long-chain fatty acid--CoA ligase [Gemmatimonadetes bacterium]|nr:long-chain fatty acid--CoA ligase [Gemmatimonadota bacterium]